jgi:4-aminobutyrate aminotransferase-like enzyme
MDHTETAGKRFREGLDALKEKHASVGDVRGMGLMLGVELVKDRKTKEPATDLANKVLGRARDNGLVIGKGGLYANVLRMSPSLNIPLADIDQAVAILDKSLAEAAKG